MRIEEHPWDREAFTLSVTDKEWTIKRRAFPPRLDPVQDRTNINGDKHYFSSLIHFFERRPPIDFCAGVNGFFCNQQVKYILLTDAIYAKDLTFNSIVTAFACMHRSQGKELVARAAARYKGKIGKVACAEGMFFKMDIDVLIMGASVVLHDYTVKQIVIDPRLVSEPLRSVLRFEEKILCNDLTFVRPQACTPLIVLTSTSQKPDIDSELPIVIVNDFPQASLKKHEHRALSRFASWIDQNRADPTNASVDRGAFWGVDLFDPSRANDQETCLICEHPISSEDIVCGHFAPTAPNKHILHSFCLDCFQSRTKSIPKNHDTLNCPICRTSFQKIGLSTQASLESSLEVVYRRAIETYVTWALLIETLQPRTPPKNVLDNKQEK